MCGTIQCTQYDSVSGTQYMTLFWTLYVKAKTFFNCAYIIEHIDTNVYVSFNMQLPVKNIFIYIYINKYVNLNKEKYISNNKHICLDFKVISYRGHLLYVGDSGTFKV